MIDKSTAREKSIKHEQEGGAQQSILAPLKTITNKTRFWQSPVKYMALERNPDTQDLLMSEANDNMNSHYFKLSGNFIRGNFIRKICDDLETFKVSV